MAFFKIVLYTIAMLISATSTAVLKGRDSVTVPVVCSNKGFCSVKPEGYDQLETKINSALPAMLVKDYTDRYGEENPIQPTKLSPKEDWHNCPYEAKTELMYTYSYGNSSTKTEIIVQTNLFKQYVETVICASQHIQADSEEQCFKDLFTSGLSSYNMKSTCQTMTTRRTLYVYDIERGQIIQKAFDVPACCTCRISYK